MNAEKSLRIGISACLLGQPVRPNGEHKRHDWLVEELGPQVVWVPVCPEVELGLGVPRELIQLVEPRSPSAGNTAMRLMGADSGRDLTEAMNAFAAARIEELAAMDLAGYVLKTKSPSCGLSQVKVYTHPGADDPSPHGRGLFAAALVARLPELPVIEEHRLAEPADRAAFLAQIRAYVARHAHD